MNPLACLPENAIRFIATKPQLCGKSHLKQISRCQRRPRSMVSCERRIQTSGSTAPHTGVSRATPGNRSRPFSSTADSPSTASEPATGFTYKLAAAYCSKSNQFDPNKHYFSYDSQTSKRYRAGRELEYDLRSRAKRLPSGQDACFVTTIGHTESVAFGVADGVGGWMQQGIDSADFAHGICMYMEEAAHTYQPSVAPLSPLELMKLGYNRVCADRSVQGGGSTACIAIADGLGSLKVANLGDSGFMHLRLNKVHHSSTPQTHAFNTPYQLSSIPPKMRAQIEDFGGGAPLSDYPDDSNTTSHTLHHGDVLVFGTDGVWDNLSSQDILGLVSDRMSDTHAWQDSGAGTDVTGLLPHLTQEKPRDDSWRPLHSLLAAELVQAAKDSGNNSKRDGPFAKAFQKAYPEEQFSGGKPDDIAVVVAIAVDPHFQPRRPGKYVKSRL